MIQSQRLISVDFMRGITVAGMILVNNPGSWDYVYKPLEHSHWNGCTLTDLIFPFFLFLVGFSINLSLSSALDKGVALKVLYPKIIKRTVILFSLGILIHAIPFTYEYWVNLRIPGVLQRIALVFFFCSVIFLHFSRTFQFIITFLILLGYWLLMTVVPVPGIGDANLEPETNLGAWLDRLVLEGHLWKFSKTWDPEGILGTLPAIASGMMGIFTGYLLKQNNQPRNKVIQLFIFGLVLIIVGQAWNIIFPINKSLWTSSYVCDSSGIAMVVLGVVYFFFDILDYQKFAQPFVYLGANAITVYVASEVLAKVFCLITFEQNNNKSMDLKSLIFSKFNIPWIGPYNASLLLALIWSFLFWLIAREMYKRKIFIKV